MVVKLSKDIGRNENQLLSSPWESKCAVAHPSFLYYRLFSFPCHVLWSSINPINRLKRPRSNLLNLSTIVFMLMLHIVYSVATLTG